MKTFAYIILSLLFFYTNSFAQTDSIIKFKPIKGNKTIEVNLSPFSSSPISLNYLRGRIFISEKTALRTGASLGFDAKGKSNKSLGISILPGIEKHFKGTNRLSPYIGAEIFVGLKSASSKTSIDTGAVKISTKVKGAWADGSNQGFLNIGSNALMGCDLYIVKHFYIGFEFGFGISFLKYSDIVSTLTVNGKGTVTTIDGGTTFNIGTNYNSSFRLGFVF